MAGFMSGFGPAFANSFSRAREASAQREQDMFKLKYADYISRRDQIESEKKQDAKDVEYAKSVAQQYGNPDAWGEIYKMKRSGVPDSQIFKRLDEYEPVISPMETSKGDTSGPADPRDGLTQGAQSSVDAQMSESGMQPPANGGIFGDLKGGLGIGSSLGMKPRGSREERVTGRIAEASGTTPDEINKTLQPRDGEPMTAVPDLKVAWKPRTKPTDWYDVKTMNDAAVNLTKAERTGNPEDIATAKAVYEALVVEDEAKSMRDAQALSLIHI